MRPMTITERKQLQNYIEQTTDEKGLYELLKFVVLSYGSEFSVFTLPNSADEVKFLWASMEKYKRGELTDEQLATLKDRAQKYLDRKYSWIGYEKFLTCLQRSNKLYRRYSIPKKTGGERRIDAPDKELKEIQKAIGILIEKIFVPSDRVHGFVSERSVVTNANQHVDSNWILNIDLKDFFPTTSKGRVKAIFKLEPFSFPEKVAEAIAQLTTLNGGLPQGSPASPAITNLVCQRLDRKLESFAISRGCVYTRYADDITFSSQNQIFNGKFYLRLEQIVRAEGYSLNIKKTRLLSSSMRQEVTGIVVNEKLNLNRNYIQGVKAMLHNLNTHGIEFCQKKLNDLQNAQGTDFMKVLLGKLNYLSMVRGKDDPTVKRFKAQLQNFRNGEGK